MRIVLERPNISRGRSQMKINPKLLTLFLFIISLTILSLDAATSAQADGGSTTPQPPMAEKKPKITKLHGETLVDDYFWLREKTNPAVMEHLKAEDAYAVTTMKPLEPLQQKLYKEMLSHIKQTDDTVPYRLGSYFYYSRTFEGKQYPVYCRKQGSLAAEEEVILDQNELAKGQKFMSVGAMAPSDDGNLLAYSTDNTGYRQYTLQIKDLRTGSLFPEKIERVDNVVWATDNKTIFYVTEDAVSKRHDKFFRHVLGSDQSELLYQENDELFDIGVQRSRDKAVIMLAAYSKTSTEFRYIPANNPN